MCVIKQPFTVVGISTMWGPTAMLVVLSSQLYQMWGHVEHLLYPGIHVTWQTHNIHSQLNWAVSLSSFLLVTQKGENGPGTELEVSPFAPLPTPVDWPTSGQDCRTLNGNIHPMKSTCGFGNRGLQGWKDEEHAVRVSVANKSVFFHCTDQLCSSLLDHLRECRVRLVQPPK